MYKNMGDEIKREKRRKPEKRVILLATAEPMLKRFGIKRISVEEICAAAQVSKMTFYKYFRNKNDLVKAILTSWIEPAYAQTEAIMSSKLSFPEKIQLLLENKQKMLEQLSDAFLTDYLQDNKEIRAFIQSWSDKVGRRFTEFLKEAQARGELIVDVKPELFLTYLEKVWELARDTKLAQLYPSYSDYLSVINRIFFYGVVPRR